MFEFYNNILCIQGGWLYDENGVMTKPTYDKLGRKGWLKKIRRGCKGTPALIEYDTIPMRFKRQIIERFGDPYEKTKNRTFQDRIEPDPRAIEYFANFKMDNGRKLKIKTQREYVANAEIMNTIKMIIDLRTANRKTLGGSAKRIWHDINDVVSLLDSQEYPHTLPKNVRRLKSKFKDYQSGGYPALVHKGYQNANSRKVTAQLERLILNLYCLPNKPYSSTVSELFLQFMGRAIDIVDTATGELFNQEDFYKNGKPITISEGTVWNYIKDPKNQPVLALLRNGAHDYNQKHRPHHHRHAPSFSMSSITMDDRDIMHTKMHDGKRVMTYYAFDDKSQMIVGYAHNKAKTHDLFLDCMRNMFKFFNDHGLGIPLQVEVEHHITRDFSEELLKAGTVFPFVRWCNPGNSQEKYAERLIHTKKYGVEKDANTMVGRHYARRDSNRVVYGKVFDEKNNTYKQKHDHFDVIVANDIEEIKTYNNQLHPNQKQYKGMTRTDVFLNYVNPDLPKLEQSTIVRYIGEKTTTSIRRNQYCKVQHENYRLSSPDDVKKLKPNNYNVDAYYLTNKDGSISEVYLYQDGAFISECVSIDKYNRSVPERGEADTKKRTAQSKYVAKYDKLVKEQKEELTKVEVIQNNYFEEVEPEVTDVTPEADPVEELDEFELLLANHDPEDIERRAREEF